MFTNSFTLLQIQLDISNVITGSVALATVIGVVLQSINTNRSLKKDFDEKLNSKADNSRVDKLEKEVEKDLQLMETRISETVSLKLDNIITLMSGQKESIERMEKSHDKLSQRLTEHIDKGK